MTSTPTHLRPPLPTPPQIHCADQRHTSENRRCDGGATAALLLGGQRLAGEIEREQGVPLLNKIPIINRAFSNRGAVRDEQTLLILIKPKIIIQREEEERQHPD